MFLFKKRIKEIFEPFNGVPMILSAQNVNYFGQESKGLGQVRGNGSLILTDSELYFEMWAPKRVLRIPTHMIKSVENPAPKWHLKKSMGRPLLKIYFTNDQGLEDSAAWLVPHLENWIQKLLSLISF
ncbi:MAG: hypothetical protein EU530_09515 [Promethearchaeota archaeon]|nr:MAG: hypothetical protein EU530_09515 [Candidatus Lokiarchaeota archaeon]